MSKRLLSHPTFEPKSKIHRALRGIFGGKTVIFGNKVSDSYNASRRKWKPNVQIKSYYSDILEKPFKLHVTTYVIKNIKKFGSFDQFLLYSDMLRDSKIGLDIRKNIVLKLRENPTLLPPRIRHERQTPPIQLRIQNKPVDDSATTTTTTTNNNNNNTTTAGKKTDNKNATISSSPKKRKSAIKIALPKRVQQKPLPTDLQEQINQVVSSENRTVTQKLRTKTALIIKYYHDQVAKGVPLAERVPFPSPRVLRSFTKDEQFQKHLKALAKKIKADEDKKHNDAKKSAISKNTTINTDKQTINTDKQTIATPASNNN